MKTKLIAVAITLVAILGSYIVVTSSKRSLVDSTVEEYHVEAVVYKSPTCGCCVGYTGFLKEDGYEVNVEETVDMNSVKLAHNIPSSMQSCHTTLIEDYFVEGHVPLKVIDKLLAEKPDLDGIALSGMPAGSPGMPGIKSEEFVIYGIKDGQVSEYMRI